MKTANIVLPSSLLWHVSLDDDSTVACDTDDCLELVKKSYKMFYLCLYEIFLF